MPQHVGPTAFKELRWLVTVGAPREIHAVSRDAGDLRQAGLRRLLFGRRPIGRMIRALCGGTDSPCRTDAGLSRFAPRQVGDGRSG
jgi:hypothetical protein